jgi:ribosomal protein S12 methylthiotransferase
MEIQQNISEELNRNKRGEVLKVLIDRREGDFFVGRTEYDSPEVDQEVLIAAVHDLKPGQFYNIRITSSTEFDLYGIPE